MNGEYSNVAENVLRSVTFVLWSFIISSVVQVFNGKILNFRTDASVRSWIWWAIMWGLDWMSWRGKRSRVSGCCWRQNWTAPIRRVCLCITQVMLMSKKICWFYWCDSHAYVHTNILLWLQVFRWITPLCWSSLNIWILIIRTHLRPKTWSCLSPQ